MIILLPAAQQKGKGFPGYLIYTFWEIDLADIWILFAFLVNRLESVQALTRNVSLPYILIFQVSSWPAKPSDGARL